MALSQFCGLGLVGVFKLLIGTPFSARELVLRSSKQFDTGFLDACHLIGNCEILTAKLLCNLLITV